MLYGMKGGSRTVSSVDLDRWFGRKRAVLRD